MNSSTLCIVLVVLKYVRRISFNLFLINELEEISFKIAQTAPNLGVLVNSRAVVVHIIYLNINKEKIQNTQVSKVSWILCRHTIRACVLITVFGFKSSAVVKDNNTNTRHVSRQYSFRNIGYFFFFFF